MFSHLFGAANTSNMSNNYTTSFREGGFTEVPEPSSTYKPLPKTRKPESFEALETKVNQNFDFLSRLGWKGLQIQFTNYLTQGFNSQFAFLMGKKETKNQLTGQLEGDRSLSTMTVSHQKDGYVNVASLNTKGNLVAMSIYSSAMFQGKFQANITAKEEQTQVVAQAMLKLPRTNVDISFQGPATVFSAVQQVTPTTQLGSQLQFIQSPQGLATQWRFIGVSGTKKQGQWATIAATGLPGFSPKKTMEFVYTKNLSKHLEFATGFRASFDPSAKVYDSSARIAYSYSNPYDGLQVNACADTNRKMSIYAAVPVSMQMSLDFSGDIDISKNTYDIGFGTTFMA